MQQSRGSQHRQPTHGDCSLCVCLLLGTLCVSVSGWILLISALVSSRLPTSSPMVHAEHPCLAKSALHCTLPDPAQQFPLIFPSLFPVALSLSLSLFPSFSLESSTATGVGVVMAPLDWRRSLALSPSLSLVHLGKHPLSHSLTRLSSLNRPHSPDLLAY